MPSSAKIASTEAKTNADASAYAQAKGKSVPTTPSQNTTIKKPNVNTLDDDDLDDLPFWAYWNNTMNNHKEA